MYYGSIMDEQFHFTLRLSTTIIIIVLVKAEVTHGISYIQFNKKIIYMYFYSYESLSHKVF